ncbi:MAG: SPFH domain-containing protein [Chloroflexi bacterium]|nr:SPFH domain-containing protein [Chloroflexota bacterium]
MDDFIVIGTGFVVFLIVLALIIFRFQWRVVPEEERLVIYRLGWFSRIAGPGPGVISRRVEPVVRTIRARDEPVSYVTQGLFIYDIPFGFTLNFWRSFDLQNSVTRDRATLAKLAQFDDNEREQMIRTKIRDALVHGVTAVQKRRPLAPTAEVIDRLLPIIPGFPECDTILAGVRQELAQTLPSIGVTLNMAHPITITRLHLNQEMIDGFARNRTTDLLRQRFPNLPEDAMIQVVTSIEGANPLNVGRISVGDSPANTVKPEIRVGSEGIDSRIKITPMPEETKAPQTTTQPASNGVPPPGEPDEHLSQDDLRVLKQVPRYTPGQKRSA